MAFYNGRGFHSKLGYQSSPFEFDRDFYRKVAFKDVSCFYWPLQILFDTRHEINTGVEGYNIYESNGIRFSIVNYRDSETRKLHPFVTTLPGSTNPGTIAMLYYKLWTIEKAFNNSKSNLKEIKAWSSDNNSLKNQMRLTAISYNLLRMVECFLKYKSQN